jgi:hypothetical protein
MQRNSSDHFSTRFHLRICTIFAIVNASTPRRSMGKSRDLFLFKISINPIYFCAICSTHTSKLYMCRKISKICHNLIIIDKNKLPLFLYGEMTDGFSLVYLKKNPAWGGGGKKFIYFQK